jgi:uncharacterized protein YecE (DUF72 family)
VAEFRLGTQGWSHPAWVGPFYPLGSKAGDQLATYARAFSTVEVDSTFYAIPAEPIVAGWRDQVPAGFVFSLKVPQEITHEKRLVDVEQKLGRFVHRVRGLGDRLGPLLLQMSPDFRAGDANRQILKRFLESLPDGFRWAVEFRQSHWVTPETTDILRERGVALTLVDGRWIKRGVMLDLALEPTADFAYVRWMGAPRRMGDRPQADRAREIGAWVEALRVLGDRVNTVFGYVSNEFQGHAPASVRQLQKHMGLPVVEPSMLREQAELF